MLAATEAAEVGLFGLGQQDIFLLKWTSGVVGGVKRRGVEGRIAGAFYQGSAGGRM